MDAKEVNHELKQKTLIQAFSELCLSAKGSSEVAKAIAEFLYVSLRKLPKEVLTAGTKEEMEELFENFLSNVPGKLSGRQIGEVTFLLYEHLPEDKETKKK